MQVSDDDRELKALLALGIIAAVGIIYQLEATHVTVAHWATPSPAIRETLRYLKFSTLVIFAGYIALLSFSLSFNFMGDEWAKSARESLGYFADLVFSAGALSLGITIFAYVYRVLFD